MKLKRGQLHGCEVTWLHGEEPEMDCSLRQGLVPTKERGRRALGLGRERLQISGKGLF